MSAYTMTLQEKRLLMLGISKINPKQSSRSQPLSFTITIDEWLDAFPDAGGSNPYTEIKKACAKLQERTLFLKNRAEDKYLSWVDSATYHKKEGRVTLRFGYSISFYLAGLLTEFTKYDLLSVRDLKSVHSIRIYELCVQFKSTGFRIIYVKDLKDALKITNSYQKFSDLRKWVIEPACREICEKTDILLEFESVKEGRRIKAIKFFIKEKKQIEMQV